VERCIGDRGRREAQKAVQQNESIAVYGMNVKVRGKRTREQDASL